MKSMINMTTSSYDMDRYSDAEDLRKFYLQRGLDGLELMFVGDNQDIPEKIRQCRTIGIHLKYFTSWLDFWKQNKEALINQFGSEEKYISFYGGSSPDALIKQIRRELDTAEKMKAEYVVFHVSEVTPEETFTYKFKHSDEEVIDAAADLINQLLDGKNYSFWFLCENLWWSGLNLKNPKITERLMKKIKYSKKGIMLDTGHLIHTDTSIRTQDQAVDYLNKVLDRHGDLCSYIKGIHLHQTVSGAYVSDFIKNPPPVNPDHQKLMLDAMSHVYKIDSHLPFTSKRISGVIERIDPFYLTHELITNDREEHEKNLDIQLRTINFNQL